MDIFVTGSTGWVGSGVAREMLKQGHEVCGLVRPPDKAAQTVEAGATPATGSYV